jgi:O-antigen/teichoic acid export membrane protein
LSGRTLLARVNERNPLPEGTFAVGAGLVVSGITAYAFIAIAGHVLKSRQDDLAALKVLWFATFALAPGFFLALEQEVGRALSHRMELGQGGRPVVRKAAVLGAVVAVFLLIAIAAVGSLVIDKAFHGSVALLLCLMLATTTWAMGHLVRGIYAGNRRFGAYGVVFGADGTVRVLFCIILAVAGIKSVGIWGLTVGIPPLIALVLSMRGQRGLLQPGPEAPWGEITANLGWLLLGSVFAAFLVNAGPIAAKVLSTKAQSKLVSDFSNGVLIARIPLFLFQAVQAALLPKLARLAASGAFDQFRNGFRKLMMLVGVVAVVGVASAFVAGPIALKVFGSELPRGDLALLATGAVIYMAAIAMSQAVIALHGHAKVGLGWAAGFATFIVALAPHDSLVPRVELALIAGSAVAAAIFWWALRVQLRVGASPDAGSLFVASHELPFEP